MNTIHRGFALEVIVQPDGFSAGVVAAEEVARAIRENPETVLGLVSGKTLVPFYKEMVRMYREEALDFSRVTVFHLDGDVGVDSTHPQSCHQIMWKNLFSLVNVSASNVHIPNLSAEDLSIFRAEYEKAIQEAGGIDIQILDIRSANRLAKGASASLLADSPHPLVPKTPVRQVLTSSDLVLNSQRCLMVASGASAALAVADAVEGSLATGAASLVLKQHSNVRIVLDEDAADKLKLKDYYQWIAPRAPIAQSLSRASEERLCQSSCCYR